MEKRCNVCTVSLEKRSKSFYRKINDSFICKKCYVSVHHPTLNNIHEENVNVI